ncbi:hypothetical protein SSS_04237 [Sarcoptes scabiei]|uniref:Uncharacterized protein n=1 Tax=Sarcoptes scabiei TaxID=52283 RepID=A0A834RB42_SARSC|nr:hypothetical protein SSS_04237 [Sarcoptes scabiei]
MSLFLFLLIIVGVPSFLYLSNKYNLWCCSKPNRRDHNIGDEDGSSENYRSIRRRNSSRKTTRSSSLRNEEREERYRRRKKSENQNRTKRKSSSSIDISTTIDEDDDDDDEGSVGADDAKRKSRHHRIERRTRDDMKRYYDRKHRRKNYQNDSDHRRNRRSIRYPYDEEKAIDRAECKRLGSIENVTQTSNLALNDRKSIRQIDDEAAKAASKSDANTSNASDRNKSMPPGPQATASDSYEYAYIVYKPSTNYIAMSRSLKDLIPPDTTVIYKMDQTSNSNDMNRIMSCGSNRLITEKNDFNSSLRSDYFMINSNLLLNQDDKGDEKIVQENVIKSDCKQNIVDNTTKDSAPIDSSKILNEDLKEKEKSASQLLGVAKESNQKKFDEGTVFLYSTKTPEYSRRKSSSKSAASFSINTEHGSIIHKSKEKPSSFRSTRLYDHEDLYRNHSRSSKARKSKKIRRHRERSDTSASSAASEQLSLDNSYRKYRKSKSHHRDRYDDGVRSSYYTGYRERS